MSNQPVTGPVEHLKHVTSVPLHLELTESQLILRQGRGQADNIPGFMLPSLAFKSLPITSTHVELIPG